jgi:nucleoside phosphorylase
MGLVRMALAAEDAYRAFHPRLLVVLGIAAAVAPEIKICDVFVARAVDLYLHRARNRMGGGSTLKASAELAIASLRTDSPIETTQRLVDFIMSDARFERDREAWKAEAAGDLDAALAAIGPLQREAHAVTIAPSVHAGTLASGEWLAAATELVEVLRARGCGAAEMEAGGAAVVRQRLGDESLPRGAPDILLIRGISDHGDENKQSLEKVGQPGMFRRLCARNASRLLLRLLANEDFAASMT